MIRDAGFVKAMNGHRYKYRCIAVESGSEPRWFVYMGRGDRDPEHRISFDYTIIRNDEEEDGIYRVYRTYLSTKSGAEARAFVGYSPTLPFALRLCATETQRLLRSHAPAVTN